MPTISSELTATPDTPTSSNPSSLSLSPSESSPSASKQAQESISLPAPLHRSMCIHKPLHIIHDLQSREGVADPCTQALEASAGDPEKSGGVWAAKGNTPTLLKDFNSMEFMFAAETADAEALKLSSLAHSWRQSADLTGCTGRKPSRRSWPCSRKLAYGDWRTHHPGPTSSAQSGSSR